jgi:putative transposase
VRAIVLDFFEPTGHRPGMESRNLFHRSRRPRGVVPYNPGLHRLVHDKNQWQDSPERPRPAEGFRGWHQRGYLPHRDAPGLTQFVTFRLADAFPEELRAEWRALMEIEEDRRRLRQLEEYLDSARGECHLQRADVARMVEEALRFFHGTRYDLEAWILMPNHVHVLFTQRDVSLSRITGTWKSYTAKEANRILGRSGQFWAEDYWDTYMRDDEQTVRTRHYIETNPVKARLVSDPRQWPWTSARFRDEYGRLNLPA